MPFTHDFVNQFGATVASLLLLTLWAEVAQAAPVLLSIKSVLYNKKTASLFVKTHAKDPRGLLPLLHSNGGVLGHPYEKLLKVETNKPILSGKVKTEATFSAATAVTASFGLSPVTP